LGPISLAGLLLLLTIIQPKKLQRTLEQEILRLHQSFVQFIELKESDHSFAESESIKKQRNLASSFTQYIETMDL
jgi:hypothetical protein